MAGGGEPALFTEELLANLAADRTPVTPDERDQLRRMVLKWETGEDHLNQLIVQGAE